LNKQLAEAVGNRLLAAAALLAEDDVAGALEQARYARRKASRVAIVREVTGVAAYGAEEWQLAVNELRAAQRLGGTHDHVALIADCERALGHPDRAIDLYREFGSDESVDPEVRVELLIVASGARRDMGMGEAATAMLKVGGLNSPKTEPWVARLRYAYAEGLLADGLEDEAREWLSKAVAADESGETGAAERLLELEGIGFEELEDETDEDDDEYEDDEDDLEEDDEDDEDDDRPQASGGYEATGLADSDEQAEYEEDDGEYDDQPQGSNGDYAPTGVGSDEPAEYYDEDDDEYEDDYEEADDDRTPAGDLDREGDTAARGGAEADLDVEDDHDAEDDLEEDDEAEEPEAVKGDVRAETTPVKDEANPDAEESDDATERRP